MFRFEVQRVVARKKLLNSKDLLNFENVPSFIINSFFGSCTYQSRLTVSTFCVLNGISCDQCMEICRFKDLSAKDKNKIENLFIYLKKRENCIRYYSYSVHYKKILYLNGDLRLHGRRIVNYISAMR